MTVNQRMPDPMRVLASLTPGGSEFYNDPERCADHVRETVSRLMERSKKLTLANQRIDVLSTALKTLLAWDSEFQFCNVDETGDTPCICNSHPWAHELTHDGSCEKYRTLVKKCQALLTDGTGATTATKQAVKKEEAR